MCGAVFNFPCSVLSQRQSLCRTILRRVGENTLDVAAVEVHQYLRRQMDFPECTQEEKPVTSGEGSGCNYYHYAICSEVFV